MWVHISHVAVVTQYLITLYLHHHFHYCSALQILLPHEHVFLTLSAFKSSLVCRCFIDFCCFYRQKWNLAYVPAVYTALLWCQKSEGHREKVWKWEDWRSGSRSTHRPHATSSLQFVQNKKNTTLPYCCCLHLRFFRIRGANLCLQITLCWNNRLRVNL